MIARNMLTFAHRSLLAVIAVAVLAPPAGAAEVARTDGARLDARDRGRTDLCLSLVARRAETGSGSMQTCAPAPWRPGRTSLVTLVTGETLTVGGALWQRRARARTSRG